MSWLFFCDESGHDGKNTPLEVRGGVAIHSSKIWSFVQEFKTIEKQCFGVSLAEYRTEVKGAKLLIQKRFEWAHQERKLSENERHNGVRRFLSKNSGHKRPEKRDFTSYGQASIMMAHEVFNLLIKHEAKLFASCIPVGTKPPPDYQYSDYLRKDYVFLQERFYWFLEAQQQEGLLIVDQTERTDDLRYIKRLENYYTKTVEGKKRSKWIVPSPIFVDSGLSAGVQAADLCLYCVNWGFRRPEWNFKGPKRDEIHQQFAGYCGNLQFSGDMVRNRKTYRGYGIIFFPDPYRPRPKAR